MKWESGKGTLRETSLRDGTKGLKHRSGRRSGWSGRYWSGTLSRWGTSVGERRRKGRRTLGSLAQLNKTTGAQRDLIARRGRTSCPETRPIRGDDTVAGTVVDQG